MEGLFGLYTYSVPNEGALSNAAILYGDNGVGKSTLLRLVFNLLSPAHNRGHRTALFDTDFQRLEVGLSSGVRLTAEYANDVSPRLLVLTIVQGGATIAQWDYRPRSVERSLETDEVEVEVDPSTGIRSVRSRTRLPRRGDLDVPRGEQAYLSALKANVPALFILNADRRLDSDTVADPSDEIELRRVMQYHEPKRIHELVARSREIALSQALGAAARWIGKKAVLGTNQGAMNVHSVYGDVLRKLVGTSSRGRARDPAGSITDLKEKLVQIDVQSAAHARYELATHLPTNDFQKALGSGKASTKNVLAAELLKPYIASVQGRLQAVDPIYQLIDRFVTIVNGLLADKTISYKLSQGFSIQNRLGLPLRPSQLSSGEQQLLLLFCYVLTARDTPTVFMIDEPEISLNIKWQRKLVQSLLDITHGSSIQFILASHSMELLAQHRNRVVRLVSRP